MKKRKFADGIIPKLLSVVMFFVMIFGISVNVVNAEERIFYRFMIPDEEYNNYYMADENGNQITPQIYHDPYDRGGRHKYYHEGYAAVCNEDSKYGFLDLWGNEVIPFIYDSPGLSVPKFNEGIAWVSKDNKFGAIDKNGEAVIPFEYEPFGFITAAGWVSVVFEDGIAPVWKNEKYGFIDVNNNEIIPIKYDDIYTWDDGVFDHNGVAKMGFGGEIVYIDKQGNEYREYPGIHVTERDGVCGMIDENGHEILPCEYTTIMGPCGGAYKVYKNSLYGFVDLEGKEITPCIYGEESTWGNYGFSSQDYVVFRNDRAAVQKNGKWGFVDKSGNEVIPVLYDDVSNFYDGYAEVEKDGERFIIDTWGNRIEWPKDSDGQYVGQRIVYGEQDISVTLNGNAISFDRPPIIVNDRTLVPLRAIFEALGATVDWNGDTQTVTSVKDEKTISLTIGSNILSLNGEPITLDVPAQIQNGRTLVPVRVISESFGVKVDWDDTTKTVLLQN